MRRGAEALAQLPAVTSIALVGSPNTGKSTLFNRLTGARERVGNYPGVTVERTAGRLRLDGADVELSDLPGTYSLAPASPDEQVVLDVLTGRIPGTPIPEAVICVVDATNLRRNLFLVSQVAETGVPIVVALNMVDAAVAQGIQIDAPRLSEVLGVPVVPTVAARGRGIEELRAAVALALRDGASLAPVRWPDAIVAARAAIAAAVAGRTDGIQRTTAELNRLLFDVDSELGRRLGLRGEGDVIERVRGQLVDAGFDPLSVEAELRYAHIDELLTGVVTRTPPPPSLTHRIDRVLTHRVFGLVAFAALMFAVFASIYWLAQPAMDGIDALFAHLSDAARAALAGAPILQSLVADGVIAGVGGVVIFLPQILVLFLFIAVLEDSGYMARAAFLMDKVFSWCGLNGKSFVPMLSSFACAVPAIMSARTIEDPRARLTTVLVSPLMSCSARLPVYVLIIGAFIQPLYGAVAAAAVLFAMHLLGLVVAIPIAMILNRFVLRVKSLPFVLEMPPYRMPRPRDVAQRMYDNGREFVVRAGTIILAFSVIIWALTYFPRPDGVRTALAATVAQEQGIALEEADAQLDGRLSRRLDGAYLERSYMARAGKAMQPLFAPAGFDWKITVGVLASFPAREIIVSTLGVIYNLTDEEVDGGGLRDRLAAATWPDGRKVFTVAVALSVMVFFAFCMQCGSTVAVMARESGWRWAAFAFVYMTALAWVGAVVTYQVGTALTGGV